MATRILEADMTAGREYVTGLYAPVQDELTVSELTVEGKIPSDLDGIFVQNMPNPAFEPGAGHSWFDGDGMVHSVEIRDGAATYRNRFVDTDGLREDRAAGQATYVGSLALPGQGKRHKNTANTDLVWHNGRLLALWWEGGVPYEIALPSLETVGKFDYNGTLDRGLTSHAKLDPDTGELYFITWGTKRPFLSVGVAGEAGKILQTVDIDLPGPRVQHDMAISQKFVCVFDFPLAIDMREGGTALGFKMAPLPSRIGLLSRKDLTAPVQWFEAQPCYMWHVMCAYDDGDEFVLLGVRTRDATDVNSEGKNRGDRPLVDGEHRFDSYLHEWRINVRSGEVSERDVDTQLAEFPRVNDLYMARRQQVGYLALIDGDAPTLRAKGIAKYDLGTYAREDLLFPANSYGYEPSFAPSKTGGAEDDGYVINYVTDSVAGSSELWITDAAKFSAGPVAKVKLPQRVPPGFHGRWIDASKYASVA